MRARRVCPEKEALHFIASEMDKDNFQKKLINEEKGMFWDYNVRFSVQNLYEGKKTHARNSVAFLIINTPGDHCHSCNRTLDRSLEAYKVKQNINLMLLCYLF